MCWPLTRSSSIAMKTWTSQKNLSHFRPPQPRHSGKLTEHSSNIPTNKSASPEIRRNWLSACSPIKRSNRPIFGPTIEATCRIKTQQKRSALSSPRSIIAKMHSPANLKILSTIRRNFWRTKTTKFKIWRVSWLKGKNRSIQALPKLTTAPGEFHRKMEAMPRAGQSMRGCLAASPKSTQLFLQENKLSPPKFSTSPNPSVERGTYPPSCTPMPSAELQNNRW